MVRISPETRVFARPSKRSARKRISSVDDSRTMEFTRALLLSSLTKVLRTSWPSSMNQRFATPSLVSGAAYMPFRSQFSWAMSALMEVNEDALRSVRMQFSRYCMRFMTAGSSMGPRR